MKRSESNILNSVLVLTGIAIFSVVTIASVYTLTKNSIEKSQRFKEQEAIRAVLPPYDHFDTIPVEMNNGVETTKVYKAYDKNNDLVGAAVESSSNNGYKGHIDIIVGFDKKGVIVNYSVLDQNETPGLGSRMVDWFKTNKAKQSIIGKNATTAHLNISADGGEIDAITAATVSSRAFLFAVRNAYFEFKSNTDEMINATENKARLIRLQQHEADSIRQLENDSTSTENNIEMKGQEQ